MTRELMRSIALATAVAVALPPQALAQPKPAPVAGVEAKEFNVERLDAMLAPVALYPDELLTRVPMASTYPLQVVQAYLEGGRMTNGFALVAWPAQFGASGIMTFIVSRDGIVFQNDLGQDTAVRAEAMRLFDPDLSWVRVDVVD